LIALRASQRAGTGCQGWLLLWVPLLAATSPAGARSTGAMSHQLLCNRHHVFPHRESPIPDLGENVFRDTGTPFTRHHLYWTAELLPRPRRCGGFSSALTQRNIILSPDTSGRRRYTPAAALPGAASCKIEPDLPLAVSSGGTFSPDGCKCASGHHYHECFISMTVTDLSPNV
jgi:hypothetical protein